MSQTAAERGPRFLSDDYFIGLKGRRGKRWIYYLYAMCYTVGRETMRLFERTFYFFVEIFDFLFVKLLFRAVSMLWRTVVNAVKKSYQRHVVEEREWFASRRSLLTEYETMQAALTDGKQQTALVPAGELQQKIGQLRREISERRGVLAKSYAVPALCLVALIVLLGIFSAFDIALKVEYDGKQLGYIRNERTFDAATEKIEDLIIGVDSRFNFASTPLYTVAYVRADQILSADEFQDAFLSAVMGDEVATACGVYIDNTFTLAVTEEDELKTFMQTLLEPYYSSEENAVIDFLSQINYETGMYPITCIQSLEDAEAYLGYVDTSVVKYTCVKTDTVESIAEKNGLTTEALIRYNPDIASVTIKKGTVIKLTIPQPYLQVKVAVRSTYTETIPYDTVIKYSSSMYEGQSEITTSGRDGKQTVVADIIYVDGVEVSRDIISTEVTRSPRDEVKRVGTKTLPKTAPSVEDFHGVTVTGHFMWPVDGGRITCGWLGYSGHYGLDIGASKGTYIYAADGGIVTSVKYWNYSYGYHLVINHGNGYQTRYAHCSKILVKEGDIVEKGQVIALVGETGKAYGCHLHFEIILNGQRINPRKYITGD